MVAYYYDDRMDSRIPQYNTTARLRIAENRVRKSKTM